MHLLFILNYLLALGGLFLLAATAFLVVDYCVYQSRFYHRYVARFVWPILLLLTSFSVVLSLVYSEYFGFIPCSLCWLQRIALYPQVLLTAAAMKLKDNVYYPVYSILSSVFGLIVATYHYIYQLLPKEVLDSGIMPCLADGSADCGSLIIHEFGFVTFPFLSAITFAFLIILHLNLRKTKA